jgi:hypothetical protein
MKLKLLLLFTFFLHQFAFSQKITFDATKKLYGIKDKNNKWLSLPAYTNITEVNSESKEGNHQKYFVAKTKTKYVILNKNGITKLSAEYDSIGLTANPTILIYKKNNQYYHGVYTNFIPSEKNRFSSVPKVVGKSNQFYTIKTAQSNKLFDADKNEFFNEDVDKVIESGNEIIFLKNNKWAFLSKPSEKYDTIYNVWLREESHYIVKKNNYFGLLNASLTVLIPFEYENIIKCYAENFALKKNGSFTVTKLLFHYNEEKDESTVKLKQVIENRFDTILGIEHYGYYREKDDIKESNKIIGIVNGKMVHVRLEDGKELVPLKFKYIRPVCEGCVEKDENRLYFVSNDFDYKKDTLNTLSFELKKLNYIYGISNAKGELMVPMEGKPLPVYTDFEPKSPIGDSIYNNYEAKDSSLLGIVWCKNSIINYQINRKEYIYLESFTEDGSPSTDSVQTLYYSIYPEGGSVAILNPKAGYHSTFIPPENFMFNFKKEIHQSDNNSSEIRLHTLNNYTLTSKNRDVIYHNTDPNIYVHRNSPVFYKENGFIGAKNWAGKKIIPPSLDSVILMNENGFKAYKKGFCTYFKYNSKDYLFESDLCFPDLSKSQYSLLCKNCDFEYLKMKIKKSNNILGIDQWGNETEYKDTVAQILPKIKAGKFNLMNNQFEKLLPEWADEIVFPVQNQSNYFNSLNSQIDVTDKIFERSLEDIISDINKHGFAVRINQNWSIRDVSGKKSISENFDSVSYKDGKWIGKKGNKINEYNSNEFSN